MNKIIYKRFVVIFMLSIAMILFLIIAFNFFVDPGNQFFHGTKVESGITQALLENKSVVVQSNYNERLVQKMMLQKISYRPDILVLGSSHIMPLTHDIFHTDRFYNASVSSASLQDDISLYYILQKRNNQPKIIIICLDPWIVSKSNPHMLWKNDYMGEYSEALKSILNNRSVTHLNYVSHIKILLEKYLQLLSSPYFESSINKFKKGVNSINQVAMEDILNTNTAICPNCFIRQPDGARIPTPVEEAMTADEADLYVMNHVNSWKDFWTESKLDPSYTTIFERFIQYLLNQKINVVFYFPPMQPLEYTQVVKSNQNYQMVFVAEKYFKEIAEKYHLQTIGAYDPAKVNLSTNNFIDSWHLKKEAINRLFTVKVLKTVTS